MKYVNFTMFCFTWGMLILLLFTKQDSHLSALYGGVLQNEPLLASAENLPVMSGYSGILQSLKGSRNSSINMPSKHFYGGNLSPLMSEKNGSKSGDGMLPQSLPLPERKRSRNISSKSKRLHIDSQDALELKLSWEEVQDMLRPPLSVKPSTVTIEDHEFEEFEVRNILKISSVNLLFLYYCIEKDFLYVLLRIFGFGLTFIFAIRNRQFLGRWVFLLSAYLGKIRNS